MEKNQPSQLHPDLVISTEAAIDRMGTIASLSASQNSSTFPKEIQLVRQHAKTLCTMYRNCREHDWCFLCSSGQHNQLFLGKLCLECKLLSADVYLAHKSKLVQIIPTS